MKRAWRWLAVAVGLAVVGGALVWITQPPRLPIPIPIIGNLDFEEVEVIKYEPPNSEWDTLLTDDDATTKARTFERSLVYPAPVDGWTLNLSNALTRLDVPMLLPDRDARLLEVHASYAQALAAANQIGPTLPSVNVIDGLAKQFDDGLYAALDLAYYSGLQSSLESHVELVRRIFDKATPAGEAAPYLAAGLSLAGVTVDVEDANKRDQHLREFRADTLRSKPIGFYTWSDPLKTCFQFLRFFQKPMRADTPIAREIAAILASDATLLDAYRKANDFYARLTNPMKCFSLAEGMTRANAEVAFFPASRSRETELFERLFPNGMPASADLMRELITRIRTGAVDLAPREDSGWYEYQAYALETMLLPERGAENQKLVLTKGYKRRMLEAFQALLTKRRETHARNLPAAEVKSAVRLESLRIAPPLRIEPAATCYLRTARGYAYLAKFLDAAVGEEAMRALHGLRQGSERSADLYTELRTMRDRMYGFYLMSCDDIGLKPEALETEGVDVEACRALAQAWRDGDWASDPDLAVDTRVSVPILYDIPRNVTRLWITLGVRLTRLQADFARPPSARPVDGSDEWKELGWAQLESRQFLIPVDEFAEVEVKGARSLSREELRALCDRLKTKEAIIRELEK